MSENVDVFEDARNPALDESKYESYPVSLNGAQGELFVRNQFPKKPGWIKALEEDRVIGADLDGLKTRSSSAALLMKIDGRHFAATFGAGRFMLDPEQIEDDFGLLVVLGSVDENRLTSVDSTTFEEKTLHARRQVSSEGPVSSFGLNIDRDILKGVAGRPREELGLGTFISGSDSLQVTAKTSLRELPEICKSAMVAYQSGEVPDAFQWVNNIKRVRDHVIVDKLDGALLKMLNDREWNNIHLAPPDVLRPEIGKYFEFSFLNGETMDDPSITKFVEEVPRRGELKMQHLKQQRLSALSEDENLTEGSWSIYKCVVAELDVEGDRYSLSGGHWYKVNRDFLHEVVQAVAGIPDSSITFPDCGHDESEGDFNERAAEALGANLLDRKTVQIAGFDRFEVCDIAVREGDKSAFVHVKKRGASSTLSHLFFQGVNSAQLLRTNEKSCERARALDVTHREDWLASVPEGGLDPGQSEICFAIITRGQNDSPLTLPFFSLVSMRNAARNLIDMGFAVTKSEIRQAAD